MPRTWGEIKGPEVQRGTCVPPRNQTPRPLPAAWECPMWPQTESSLRVLPLAHQWASLGPSSLMCKSSQRAAGCRARVNRENRGCLSFQRPASQLGDQLAQGWSGGQGVAGAAYPIPGRWGWRVSCFLKAHLWSSERTPGAALTTCHTPLKGPVARTDCR